MALIDIIYIASAVIGGLLFLFRLVLMIFGGAEHDGGIHLGDFGNGGHELSLDEIHSDADADSSFKFLSIQSISAFFMMFGLVGLALSRANVDSVWTVLGGTAAGAFTVWVVSLIFKGMKRLQSDGTLRIGNARGLEGTVYLTIPSGGTGKVSVVVQGGLKEFDAVSVDKQAIPTGDRIQVVDVMSGSVLLVKSIQKNKPR